MNTSEFDVVRCVFCKSGFEPVIVSAIERQYGAKAIFPTRVKRMRICKNGWQEQLVPLLPGYVFVYSDGALKSGQIQKLTHVIRVLRYRDEPEGDLRGADRAFARHILDCEGVIKVLQAVRVGDRVKIIDGIFEKLKGRVQAMDKRRQVAMVELEVAGNVSRVWLSFEYLRPGE